MCRYPNWRDCDGARQKSAIFGKARVFRDLELNAVFATVKISADFRVASRQPEL